MGVFMGVLSDALGRGFSVTYKGQEYQLAGLDIVS